MANGWQSWLREPLLQFVLLGGLVFGSHALITRKPATDERQVAITREVRGELEKEFSRRHGRAPNPDEAAKLEREWANEEVLFREGLRMGLDRGDPIIRNRVVSKMKSVLEGLVIVPEPSDAELEQWLTEHRARYETPVRWDLEHVFVDRKHADAKQRAERQLAELDEGGELAGRGDPFPSGGQHENRSHDYLARTFGKPFAEHVQRAPLGRWQIVESEHGYHVVRVKRKRGGDRPTLAALRGKLARDWQTQQKKALVDQKLEELVKSYELELEP